MKKIWTLTLIISLSLGSCVTVSQGATTSTPPVFVTSTLPPTQPGLSLPTVTPDASTSSPTTPGTPGTPDGTGTAAPTGESATGACQDSALMIADVTVPDNAPMTKGQKFTKTWRFMNNGNCSWNGYTIAFAAGDRMSSPDTAPVPQTGPGETVDVSVELTAPSVDGSYTGFFELRNASGQTLGIGIEPTFWVKILIGNVA
ncbi:MAG: NBR1-Ig-like domain-containing protein, partial [Chloroflexota bacterium]|nr:NBR1-Ig-like domain-containing protein [Chloroflexota bacterium]